MDAISQRLITKIFVGVLLTGGITSFLVNSAYAVPAGASMQFVENRAIQERAQQELQQAAPREEEKKDDIKHEEMPPHKNAIKPEERAGEGVEKRQLPANINK